MRLLIRVAVPTAALALTGAAALPAAGQPAAAPAVGPPAAAAPTQAAGVFLELNPSTIQAGDEIGLRASCDDNLTPATATAEAFGTVTLDPRFGFLTATVTVPAGTDAGDYRVRLDCPEGPDPSATLRVLTRTRPSRGPATGFGGTAGDSTGGWLITGGLAAMAAGAGLGLLTVRRRRAG